MCMDVEDVAPDVASHGASHERLAPETELRFGVAVRVAITEHERHALVQRAPSRFDDFFTQGMNPTCLDRTPDAGIAPALGKG